jgi:hypothetical protein
MFSPPAVSVPLGLVYGTFGQPYTIPASVKKCQDDHGGFFEGCEQPGSFLRLVVAFDSQTGEPRWSYRVQGHEPWLRACGSQPPVVTWCAPEADTEKWDFRRIGRQRHAPADGRTGAMSSASAGRAASTRCSTHEPAPFIWAA